MLGMPVMMAFLHQEVMMVANMLGLCRYETRHGYHNETQGVLWEGQGQGAYWHELHAL